ncbi:MAG: hypothetical protein L3J05_08225 [Robiginitomaculum sp.]|nr:hypothetical protein [Robiginitomaculum sp.]
MRSVAELEAYIEAPKPDVAPAVQAADYLLVGEEMLIHWLIAKDLVPTEKEKEGFRVLALHRQGCKGDPSFNACRETCRELAYYYNLITLELESEDIPSRLAMMDMVAKHLVLFIGGKMQEEQVGEFCCSSKVNKLSREEVESLVGVNNG